ncbi:MAG: class B sortase [Clostridia bacterium]|nr:class B sortase [Clostridia bacterium]
MRTSAGNEKNGLPWLRIAAMVLAAAVFCYAGWQLFLYWNENNASGQTTQELIDQAVEVVSFPKETPKPSVESSAPVSSELPYPEISYTIPLRVNFEALQAQNPDIVAWIYCEGTPIHYPVVQGEDNQYYLHRLTDGSYNANGTIFMDFRNERDFSDRNTLIYGHNMTNDAMFGCLSNYKEQAFYDEHPQMWILTADVAYRVDLVAGFVTASDSDDYSFFGSEDELQAHLEEAVGKSTFVSNVDLAGVERIVTLSTCTYEYNTARYVVVGSLVPAEYPR